MTPDSVIDMSRSLMVTHGVGYLQFGFHHYPDRPGIVGRCHTVPASPRLIPSKITLDEHWIEILPDWKIRETVLHEIAHAKAPMYPNSFPHDTLWKIECIRLGIKPNIKFQWSGQLPDSMNNFVPVP